MLTNTVISSAGCGFSVSSSFLLPHSFFFFPPVEVAPLFNLCTSYDVSTASVLTEREKRGFCVCVCV